MDTINDMHPQFANRADQVISMTVLRRSGRVLLDRIANGEQDKYFVMRGNKPVYVILPIGGDMELNHVNQIEFVSASDLQHKGRELLNRFKHSTQKRYIVIRHNKLVGVVMPIKDQFGIEMNIVMYEVEALINKLIPHREHGNP